MTRPDVSTLPRVLVVTTRLDIGGTEQHLLRILPPLCHRGLDISLYVLERGGRLENALVEGGVQIAGPYRRLPRHMHAIVAGLKLRRYLRHSKPDIVHFFLSEPYLIGSAASFGMRTITRIMSRRSLNTYQRKRPMLARLEQWLHKRTSVLLANSSAVAADLVGECGQKNKIGLIRNGLPMPEAIGVEQRQEAQAQLKLSPKCLVFAVNANLIPYKGHRDLFDAIGLIKDRLPASWRMLLIGRDQGVGEELRRMAQSGGFAENVMWLGERSDAQDLLAAADVVLLPSHEEGFSNSLIEAMGRGLPVIATAVGGNIDAVTHDETGLLVPAMSPDKLAAAMLRLCDDANLRLRLGAAARARVLKEFMIEDCVARYFNLYRSIPLYGRTTIQDLIDGEQLLVR